VSRSVHQAISLQWEPWNPRIDQTIAIKFQHLPRKAKVRLDTTLTTPGEKLRFLSSCIFHVDSTGTLDLSTTPCEGPSYRGVDPMGIFWSMDPLPGSLTRLYSSGPLHYAIIFDQNNQKLFSTSLTRNIYDKTVTRQDFRRDGVVGTLFIPAGQGPFPTIMVIEGAARIKEDLAAALASKGFVVLAVAFFKVEGLPKDYSHVRVEYFERAIDLLQGLDCVQEGGVGVVGCSKGCDISISCAAFLPLSKVRAVVGVNGGVTSALGKTSYGSTTIQKHPIREDFKPRPSPIPGCIDLKMLLKPLDEIPDSCRIPVENSTADILMIAGEDDQCYESVKWAEEARKICEYSGRSNFSMKTYPGMGHALDAPFAPISTAILRADAPKGTMVYLGGKDKKEASRSQLKCFYDIVQFFGLIFKRI